MRLNNFALVFYNNYCLVSVAFDCRLSAGTAQGQASTLSNRLMMTHKKLETVSEDIQQATEGFLKVVCPELSPDTVRVVYCRPFSCVACSMACLCCVACSMACLCCVACSMACLCCVACSMACLW